MCMCLYSGKLVKASQIIVVYDPVIEEASAKITISSKLRVVIIYRGPSFLPLVL